MGVTFGTRFPRRKHDSKIAEANPAQVVSPTQASMENSTQLLLLRSIQEISANGNDTNGYIMRIGRATVLISNHADFIPVLRKGQHRPREVFAIGRIDP